ncbi:MAG: prepilin peptidase [Candidatus Omnitrophota bacterium]|nr:prepilin peptidase [Candidatus Omnitrophota bacterium]
MEYFIVFVAGVIIGSFLNVCIYRTPLGKSIVRPRSHCPFCEHTIGWFDNIPLISFFLLRGRCRHCGRRIPLRYFLVEFVTAVSGIALLLYFSLSLEFFVYWFFTCVLIAVVGIDIEHQEIPDIITVPGIFIGVALMTVFRLDGSSVHLGSFMNSVLGVLAGGCSMFLLGVAGELVFRKEALGGGDVKLMGMIGAVLGWKLVLLTFFLAPLLGVGVGLFMKIRFRKEEIAYGPYLALGAMISLMYGNRILDCLFGF